MQIQTLDLKKNQLVKAGELVGDIFYKTVKRKHYCWKHQGWGISMDVISELRLNKCNCIIFKEGKDKYGITLAEFIKKAVKDNLGSGYQYFIAEKELDYLTT